MQSIGLGVQLTFSVKSLQISILWSCFDRSVSAKFRYYTVLNYGDMIGFLSIKLAHSQLLADFLLLGW